MVRTPEGTILLAYRGSIAHNMYVPSTDPDSTDDVDLMGFVIPEPRYYIGLSQWGTRGTQEIKEGKWDCVFYELRKAVSLLLQGNPNVLSMLWLRPEHYLVRTPEGDALLAHRGLFVGKHVYDAFAGYAHDQLIKMESRDPADLRQYLALTAEAKHRGIHPNHRGERIAYPAGHDGAHGEGRNAAAMADDTLLQGLRSYMKKGQNLGYLGEKRKHLVLTHGYDAKNAAHCVRLLRMCKEFLVTGEMQVYLTTDADELLAIKRGKWPLSEVKALAGELFLEIQQARESSPLPDAPDVAGVERLLMSLIGPRVYSMR